MSTVVIGFKKFLSHESDIKKDWTGFFKTASQGDKIASRGRFSLIAIELKLDGQRALSCQNTNVWIPHMTVILHCVRHERSL